jgi:rhodanese-related sulfurtransferase
MAATVATLVEEAKARVEALDPDRLARELEAGSVVVIDLREPEELAEVGTIPGSVHIPRGMLEFRADPSSPYAPSGLHRA